MMRVGELSNQLSEHMSFEQQFMFIFETTGGRAINSDYTVF